MKIVLFYLSFFMAIINLSAQKLNLVNIEETRSMSGTWDFCKLEVQLYGDEVRNYTYYRIGEIISAKDNKGLNLIPETPSLSEYKPVNEHTTIQLLKTARSATTLSIDGMINLYKPTEANGGIVKISGYRTKPDINLAPKGAAYSVYYFDQATLRKKSEVDYMKRQEVIDNLPEKDRSLASNINGLVNSLSYYNEDDLTKTLFFVIGGEYTSILGFEFEDAKGKKISPVSTSSTGGAYTFYFEQQPDPGMKVVLNIESFKAVKSVPFSLRNIDLP